MCFRKGKENNFRKGKEQVREAGSISVIKVSELGESGCLHRLRLRPYLLEQKTCKQKMYKMYISKCTAFTNFLHIGKSILSQVQSSFCGVYGYVHSL